MQPESETLAAAWRLVAGGGADALLDAGRAAVRDPAQPAPAELVAMRRASVEWLGSGAAMGASELDADAWAGLVIGLLAARRRAAARFTEVDELLLDRAGLEQASGTMAARHKARRFRKLHDKRVFDLCCGIGGDARELVRVAGCDVLGVDLDPVSVVMAAHNAGCETVVADVSSWPVGDCAGFHLDPARRGDAGRIWRLEDFLPGPQVIDRWVDSGLPGAVKLGPGADLDALPWAGAVEIEIIGDHRGLRQAVLWCGPLAERAATRTATCTDLGVSFTGSARPTLAGSGEVAGWLWEPHRALERPRLVGALLAERRLDAVDLAPGLGLLTAHAPTEDPWFTCFEVLAELPLKDKPLRRWLRAHDGGVVEVKTRGGAADAGALQKQLSGAGATPYTVFALRLGSRRRSLVTRRVP